MLVGRAAVRQMSNESRRGHGDGELTTVGTGAPACTSLQANNSELAQPRRHRPTRSRLSMVGGSS